MTCPDCQANLDQSLAEVRRVNAFLRRFIYAAGLAKAKGAMGILKEYAMEASVVLEGRAMSGNRRDELKRKYQG